MLGLTGPRPLGLVLVIEVIPVPSSGLESLRAAHFSSALLECLEPCFLHPFGAIHFDIALFRSITAVGAVITRNRLLQTVNIDAVEPAWDVAEQVVR